MAPRGVHALVSKIRRLFISPIRKLLTLIEVNGLVESVCQPQSIQNVEKFVGHTFFCTSSCYFVNLVLPIRFWLWGGRSRPRMFFDWLRRRGSRPGIFLLGWFLWLVMIKYLPDSSTETFVSLRFLCKSLPFSFLFLLWSVSTRDSSGFRYAQTSLS